MPCPEPPPLHFISREDAFLSELAVLFWVASYTHTYTAAQTHTLYVSGILCKTTQEPPDHTQQEPWLSWPVSNSHPREAWWRIIPIPLASPQRSRETFPIQIRLSKCLLNIPIHASDPTLLAASRNRKTKHPRVAHIFDVVHLFFQLIGGPAIHDHFLLLVGIRSAHHTIDNTLRKLPCRLPMAWFWRLGKGRKWEKECKSHKHSTNNGYPLTIKQSWVREQQKKEGRRPAWHLLVILDLA